MFTFTERLTKDRSVTSKSALGYSYAGLRFFASFSLSENQRSDRDVLRFHRTDKGDSSQFVVDLQIHSAPFGHLSPFLLGGTLNQHLAVKFRRRLPRGIKEIGIMESLYVDDFLSRGSTLEQVQTFKSLLYQLRCIIEQILHGTSGI